MPRRQPRLVGRHAFLPVAQHSFRAHSLGLANAHRADRDLSGTK